MKLKIQRTKIKFNENYKEEEENDEKINYEDEKIE